MICNAMKNDLDDVRTWWLPGYKDPHVQSPSPADAATELRDS
jgi:hypothetical protein